MRLLFDHNLSHKLVARLADLFPDSTQTRFLGFERTDDQTMWDQAKVHGYVIATLDADFSDLSLLRGIRQAETLDCTIQGSQAEP